MRERRAYEKEIEKLMHRCVSRLVRFSISLVVRVASKQIRRKPEVDAQKRMVVVLNVICGASIDP